MSRARALPLVLLLAAAGCGGRATELIVVVDSDIPAPSVIDAMHIVVTGPSGTANLDKVVPYTGAPPLTLGLVPEGAALEPVTVLVEAQHSGATVLSRTVITGFESGVQRVLHIRLVQACLYQTCAAMQTCDEHGACVMLNVAASSLPTFTGKVIVDELCNGYDDNQNGRVDETFDLNNDPGHCGSCTMACDAGEPCVSGHCMSSPVVQIAVGAAHACALRMAGTLACWGDNTFGELGTNDGMNHPLPTTVAGVTDAVSVWAGYGLTCIVHRDGSVSCAGSNGSGESGQPMVGPSVLALTPVPGVASITEMGLGSIHECALRGSGGVTCWGTSLDGRLGNGTLVDGATAPTMVMGLADAAYVDTGLDHSCAVRTGGSVQCWGKNDRGQLGDGTLTSTPIPVTVAMLSGVTTGMPLRPVLSLGSAFGCAVTGGHVACWGDNSAGQIGLAVPMAWDPMTGPHTIPGITGTVTAVSAAPPGDSNGCSACALLMDGTAECWGCNLTGQLGDGTMGAGRATAAPVMNLTNVTQLDTGASFACALKSDASVWCWGQNTAGQLGNGTMTPSTLPIRVTGL